MSNYRVLLDSHAFLFAAGDPSRLTRKTRQMLEDESCEVNVSVATIWELLLKARKGTIDLGDDPTEELQIMCRDLKANVLSVIQRHAYQCMKLGGFHKDPFDRLLVAQAQLEELVLVTRDRLIAKYNVKTTW